MTSTTLADGQVIGFSYDAAGNLMSLTPSGKPAHGFNYTPVDLVSMYSPPAVEESAATSTQYEYNIDQQLTRMVRPDGQAVVWGYDGAGRLSTTTLPTGAITRAYTPSTGHLQSLSGPYGQTLTYSRDGSLVTGVAFSGPVAGTVSWVYDSNFRVSAETVNGGNAASFTYDSDSILTAAGALSRSIDAASGRLMGTALGNVTDAIGYDTYGQLASYEAFYQGSPLLSVSYAARDELGRIKTKLEAIGGESHSYEYGYDLRGRLSEVKKNSALVAHYDYDANGNRLNDGAVYDAQDRLLSLGTKTYSYTANGELRSKTDSATGETTNYQYDVQGNLLRVDLPDGRVIEYIVDGLGRRVGKKINGVLVQGLLYRSQLQPVAELDGSGAVVGQFVYVDNGRNVPDYVIRGATAYRVITDHLGSVRLVINAVTGKVVQQTDYDVWGVVIREDIAPGWKRVPFGFAGGLVDQDTNLIRFGARDYSADIARWTAKDPIGFHGRNVGLYNYCYSDPLNIIDIVPSHLTRPRDQGSIPKLVPTSR